MNETTGTKPVCKNIAIRKALYITVDDTVNVDSDNFMFDGWEVTAAYGIKDAESFVMKNEDCYVGIVSIQQYSNACMNKIENFVLKNNHMEWVLYLKPELLLFREIGLFIMNNIFDYHSSPLDLPRLKLTLGHAYGRALLKSRVFTRNSSVNGNQMVGTSAAMLELYSKLEKISNTESPVLIHGESGTGKELAARAIHHNSSRSQGPFIAVNCGALPVHLVQSELFGYERGAFTGATQRKIGLIESAEGGTIFLDEIGDLSLTLQVTLLRFLQDKTVDRVGSRRSIKVDVRIIAATHVDLEKAVQKGNFREDLFYRLNVLRLDIPPLRDRVGDIELLAYSFFEKFYTDRNPIVRGFSQQALRVMSDYGWPGNVRELMNRVRRAMVMCEKSLITPYDLELEDKKAAVTPVGSLDDARLKAETDAILRTLQHNNNNVSKSARELGVSRVTLYRLMNKLNILA